jgi:fructoselysine-6-P-deglycase FrlB-like protein
MRPESCFEEDRRTLVFGLSRTGETPETIRALQIARDRQGFPIIPVTCYPDSILAGLSSRSVLLPEAREDSSIMTRAFTGILAAFLFWAGLAKETKKLPEAIAESLNRHSGAVEEMAVRPYEQVVFLGSGPFLPVTRESALKLTEMAGLAAQAAQTYEFRHGSQRLLGRGSLVWLFAGREDIPYLNEVIPPLRELGAEVLVSGCRLPDSVSAAADFTLNQTCTLASSEVEAAALVHLTQLYAFFRTVHLGGHPDHPEGLSRVTALSV